MHFFEALFFTVSNFITTRNIQNNVFIKFEHPGYLSLTLHLRMSPCEGGPRVSSSCSISCFSQPYFYFYLKMGKIKITLNVILMLKILLERSHVGGIEFRLLLRLELRKFVYFTFLKAIVFPYRRKSATVELIFRNCALQVCHSLQAYLFLLLTQIFQ